MNATCVCSSFMGKVKKPLMAIPEAYAESVTVSIAAPIN